MRTKIIRKLRESSKELRSLQDKPYSIKATTELSFEPNPDMGEGEASKEELEHRRELILSLLPFYKIINDILKITDAEKQLKKIESELAKFTDDAIKNLEKTVPDRYNLGVGRVNDALTKKKQEPIQIKDNSRRDAILRQQTDNIKIISSDLENKLRQKINLQKVSSYYPQDETLDLEEIEQEEIDALFKDSVNRLDSTGFFGFNESYQSGILEAAIIAGITLSHIQIDIYVDTVGDENVCEECDERSDNGPYPPGEVPEDPHFGCRCSLRIEIMLV